MGFKWSLWNTGVVHYTDKQNGLMLGQTYPSTCITKFSFGWIILYIHIYLRTLFRYFQSRICSVMFKPSDLFLYDFRNPDSIFKLRCEMGCYNFAAFARMNRFLNKLNVLDYACGLRSGLNWRSAYTEQNYYYKSTIIKCINSNDLASNMYFSLSLTFIFTIKLVSFHQPIAILAGLPTNLRQILRHRWQNFTQTTLTRREEFCGEFSFSLY